jgi:hypothetical protein
MAKNTIKKKFIKTTIDYNKYYYDLDIYDPLKLSAALNGGMGRLRLFYPIIDYEIKIDKDKGTITIYSKWDFNHEYFDDYDSLDKKYFVLALDEFYVEELHFNLFDKYCIK